MRPSLSQMRPRMLEANQLPTGSGIHEASQDYPDHKYFALWWLNSCVVILNNLYAYMYRHILNAPLLSEKSVAIKRRLMLVEDQSKRELAKRELLGTLLSSNPDKLVVRGGGKSRESKSKLAATRDICATFDGRPTKRPSEVQLKTTSAQRSSPYSSLTGVKNAVLTIVETICGIPKRSNLLYTFIMLFELSLLFRFVLVCIHLSDLYPKKSVVSCGRPTVALKHEALRSKRPLSIQIDSSNTECVERIKQYYDETYAEHLIWNASQPLTGKWPGVEVFDIRFEEGLNQNYLRTEVGTYNYLMACFMLTCGLFWNHLASKTPYDVTALVLIYDPKFVAAHVRLRLNKYLNLVRQSYMNFWSAFDLNIHNDLIYREETFAIKLAQLKDDEKSAFASDLDEASDREKGDLIHESSSEDGDSSSEDDQVKMSLSKAKSKPLLNGHRMSGQVVDNVCLNYKVFNDYMPTARSLNWRRFLVIAHPLCQSLSMWSWILIITVLWLAFLLCFNNAHTNTILKSFLMGEDDADSPVLADFLRKSGMPWSQECRDILLASSNQIKKALVKSYATSLNQISGDQLSISSLNDDQLRSRVVEVIGPIGLSPLNHWMAPIAGALMVCLIISLYLTIFFMTILDLCFWLIELRLKFNVCIKILEHYHGSESKYSKYSKLANDRTLNGRQERVDFEQAFNFDANARLDSNKYLSRAPPPRMSLSKEQQQQQQQIKWDNWDDNRKPQKVKGSNWRGLDAFQSAGSNSLAGAKLDQMTNSLCNVEVHQILVYLLSTRVEKENISEFYAHRLISMDLLDSLAHRKATEKFLVSTYLDFRLLLDQIDDCRWSINLIIGTIMFHSINITVASTYVDEVKVRACFLITVFMAANVSLINAAFFESQCCKLHGPIHSILAMCIRGNKMMMHLALLWRRSLMDLTGCKSKFSFGIYSLKINYASLFQLNLSVVSLYILILDRRSFEE